MTDIECNCGDDLQKLLQFLRESGRASDRKLRLFACACCRRIWHAFRDGRSRAAVEVAESFADEWINDAALRAAWAAARWAARVDGKQRRPATSPAGPWAAAASTEQAAMVVARDGANSACREAADTVASSDDRTAWRAAWEGERRAQMAIAQDIFKPLRFGVLTVDPVLLTYNNGVVVKLAQDAYDHRCLPDGTLDPARLSALGAALSDAGCRDEEILRHCGSEGPHTRGCWVVDLVVGKE